MAVLSGDVSLIMFAPQNQWRLDIFHRIPRKNPMSMRTVGLDPEAPVLALPAREEHRGAHASFPTRGPRLPGRSVAVVGRGGAVGRPRRSPAAPAPLRPGSNSGGLCVVCPGH